MVVLIHLGLGAALLHGLAGEPLRRSVEALTTFDVPLPDITPPPPPARQPRDTAEEREEGATDIRAEAAPVVRPPPEVRLPTPPVLRTADDASPTPGAAASAGAGTAAGQGAGSGSGGSGTGGGGAGEGFGTIGSEARLLSGNLSRSDYRRIRGYGAPRGQAILAIEVGAEGRVTRCSAFASSGNSDLDDELCRLLGRTRWQPARNRGGTPIPVSLRYVATWDRG